MITFAVQFLSKVSKNKREFVIPFIGLKTGSHTFKYDISDTFFEDFEYSIIQGGNVEVELILEKKETMMIGHFSCEGEVNTSCDRCNDPLNVMVNGEFQLIFKLSTEGSDDENLIVLPPEAYELDVAAHIYELITVSLPLRSIHDQGECNEEMVSMLSQFLVNPSDDEDDEDWDDEDWDDEDYDDEDFDDDELDEDMDDEGDDDNPDKDIDPRWSILKSLN